MLVSRKKYFIKKDLQTRFILRFVAVATIWAVTTVVIFAYLAGKKLDDLRYSSHIDLQTTGELLLPITITAHLTSLLIFISILAYTIHSLWQRLTPPLTALKRSMKRISDGDLMERVVLRNDDEFQDLAQNLEKMRRGLREKIIRLKEGNQELASAAEKLSCSALEGKPSPTFTASLQAAVGRMKEDVQSFRF